MNTNDVDACDPKETRQLLDPSSLKYPNNASTERYKRWAYLSTIVCAILVLLLFLTNASWYISQEKLLASFSEDAMLQHTSYRK